jgi:hypothetical protein
MNLISNFYKNFVGVHFRLLSAIEYRGIGTGGHCIAWRRNNAGGWTALDDDRVVVQRAFPNDLALFTLCLFERLPDP